MDGRQVPGIEIIVLVLLNFSPPQYFTSRINFPLSTDNLALFVFTPQLTYLVAVLNSDLGSKIILEAIDFYSFNFSEKF